MNPFIERVEWLLLFKPLKQATIKILLLLYRPIISIAEPLNDE
jgi:hypothetical protein